MLGESQGTKSTTTLVQVPAEIFDQCELLRKSAQWLQRTAVALETKTKREYNDDHVPQYYQIRVRLFALNGIGQRLHVLLKTAERGNEAVQTGLVRQIIEFLMLAAYKEPIQPKKMGPTSWAFMTCANPQKTVRTYGDKFISHGFRNLTNSADLQGMEKNLRTLYANTSAFIHPSPQEFICCIEGNDGERFTRPPGIAVYAEIVHVMLAALCFTLNKEYELDELTETDELEYLQGAQRRGWVKPQRE